MDEVILRDATEADLPTIVAIYNSAIAGRMATADLEPVMVELRRSWFEEHNPKSRPLWVLAKGAQVVAWLSFQPFYGRPAYQATSEVSVYVAPRHHRKGYARRLVGEAVKRAPGLELKTLLAFIFGHNDPSIALFRSFGFKTWAHLPAVAALDGIERDLLILGRRVA
ncbi:MAG: GNAT family N-acetyltransferase [Candidatus Binataceae bacterium]